MKNFNKTTFILSTTLFGLLLIPSFLAAWAEDEGTLGTNIVWTTFAKLFYVLRFPTHTLFWAFITKSSGTFFFLGLGLNCLFYGFITERLIAFYKILRHDIAK